VKRKVALAVALLLLATASALGFFWPWRSGETTLRLSGIVEIQEVRLASKVGGRVAEVLVREGDLIRPGQRLVVFDAPELQAQRAQVLARLEAAIQESRRAENGPRPEEIEAARATAAAAHARYLRAKAGWRVEEKQQAASELEVAEADLKHAEEEFVRVADLYRRQSAARAEYDLAWSRRDQARGRVSAARARHEMLQHGSRQEDIDAAEGEWKQAEANHALLKAGTREEDKLAARARVTELRGRLEEIDANLAEHVVTAPEQGVVEVLAVRKGDVVPPNQPVVRLLRAEDLWVRIYVPETELGKVPLNQKVEVKVDSYPDKRFIGVVRQISSISEFTPRNVQSLEERRYQVFGVKVYVDNPQGVFMAGMAAEVTIPLQGAP
jgi:multidrug resistance efflux pump